MSAFAGTPWPFATLGDVCAPKELVDPRRSPKVAFQYIDISGVCNERFEVVCPKPMTGADAPSRARKKVRTGDVIVATTRPYLRSIARIPPTLDQQICSTGFCVLRPTSRVVSDWLFYCCLSDGLVGQLTPKMRGANYPAVSDSDVLQSVVPLPPLPEQRRIVGRIRECMARIDELRELRTRAIEEASALMPALLAERFGPLLADGDSVPLGSITTDCRYGTSLKCHGEPTGTAVLRIPNVQGGEISLRDLKYTRLPSRDLHELLLRPGDLLFVRTNGSPGLVGRCAVYDHGGDYAYASYLIRFRLDAKRVLPAYVSAFLASAFGRKEIAARRKTSAGQYNINSESLKTIPIPLVPLGEQQKLVRDVAELRQATTQMLTEMRAESAESLAAKVLEAAFAGRL